MVPAYSQCKQGYKEAMSVSRTEFLGALVAERAPLLLAIAVVLSGVVLLPKLFSRVAALDHLPLVGKELGGPDERRKAYMADSTSLYEEGYKRYEGKPFRITTSAGTYAKPGVSDDGCVFYVFFATSHTHVCVCACACAFLFL